MIPYAKPNINNSDIKSVIKVLQTPFLTQGSKVPEFEKKITEYTGSKHAVAVNSATSALHLACLSIGLKKGDYVWTVSNSFVASANAAVYCNANIDFVDINERNFNFSLDHLIQKLKKTKKNKLPKVFINVHFGGLPDNQKRLKYLSNKYGFKIIEDASHSLGASFLNQKVGSCKWADMTIFSFHPVKTITTAEGGMITTNNKKYFDKLLLLRTHGITKNKDQFKFKMQNISYYEQQYLGFNYRMNDIEASLGISQLKRIDKFVLKRNEIARAYLEKLKDLPIFFQRIDKEYISSYHLFVIKINAKKVRFKSNFLIKELRKNNIYSCLHYPPIHLHPFYREKGFRNGYLPNTEDYSNLSLSLPIFFDLKKNELNKIINVLHKIFKLYA